MWGRRDLNADLRLTSGKVVVITIRLNPPQLEAHILPGFTQICLTQNLAYTTSPQISKNQVVLLRFLFWNDK